MKQRYAEAILAHGKGCGEPDEFRQRRLALPPLGAHESTNDHHQGEFQNQATQYQALAHNITVRLEYPNMVVTEGTMSMRLATAGGEKNIETRTLMIWRSSNDEWKLLNFQATAV